MTTAGPAYLIPGEIAERYRVPVSTVRYWRHIGYGPAGVRAGNHVLYPIAEVEKFDRELAGRAANGTAARLPGPPPHPIDQPLPPRRGPEPPEGFRKESHDEH